MAPFSPVLSLSLSLACTATLHSFLFNRLLQRKKIKSIQNPLEIRFVVTEILCFKENIALKSELLYIITLAQHISHAVRASALGLDNVAQLCTEYYAISCYGRAVKVFFSGTFVIGENMPCSYFYL